VALSLLLEELHLCTADREIHLDLIVAAYVGFGRVYADVIRDADIRISQAIKALSVPDFSSILDLVSDGLSHSGLDMQDLGNLVHLSSVMLPNAPEGTLKITQGHFTRSLSQFVKQRKYIEDPDLRISVLAFVSKHFNERPAAARLIDVSNVWTLLGACLASSSDHNTTEPSTFQEIVSIISALIRLRRDLVLPTLPHLGMMLRRLITCLKALPPYISGRQCRMFSDTLPRWINPSTPLTAKESQALARLLTTLTTKTIIRIHGSTSEIQKAESLSRPFSKHASMVLGAYIEALNDPLCILGVDVRRELEPGLFALCDMMGEQNRDAMMVSLDSGGKTSMKAIWREYDKQRYVGRG